MLERLQKIIARAGIASRRHAEQLIVSGQVRVNGQVVTELGSKADAAEDRIEAAGKLVEANERRIYLVLNKPPEVVSTMADPEGRKTLRNFLRGLPERVYPVGRLDYDASGLVFLTNDGDLAAEMLKDWSNLQQVYHVKIKGRLLMGDLERLGRNADAVIRTVRQPDASRGHAENFWYEATLQDSRKDILRRVLFAEKHPVEKLKRIGLGPLNLEGLPQGRYRLLVEKEVAELRTALKIKPKLRSSFVPAESVAEQGPKPFVHVRPQYSPKRSFGRDTDRGDSRRPGHIDGRGVNRTSGRAPGPPGHRKSGPRPSRPPSPNRLEAEDREALQQEGSRPSRPFSPNRPGSTRPSPNRPAPGRPGPSRPTSHRPEKWNQSRGPNRQSPDRPQKWNQSRGPVRSEGRDQPASPYRPSGPGRPSSPGRPPGPGRPGNSHQSKTFKKPFRPNRDRNPGGGPGGGAGRGPGRGPDRGPR